MAERVPFTRQPEYEGKHGFVVDWNVATPPINGDIAYNPRRLQRACRLAGIRTLVINSTGGEISQFDVNVVSTGSDGSAVAGKVGKMKPSDLSGSSMEGLSKPGGLPLPIGNTRWVDGEISVNTNEIAHRIQHDQSVRMGEGASAHVWGRYVNIAVKEGLRAHAIGNLLLALDPDMPYGFNPFEYAGIGGGAVALALSAGEPYFPWPMRVALYSTVLNGLIAFNANSVRKRSGMPRERTHLSLFGYPQIDRFIALDAYLMTRPFVKGFR